MYGLIDDDDFKVCERTVRLCIEALPTNCGCSCSRADRSAIEALLPAPAKALVEECKKRHPCLVGCGPELEVMARWLFSTGRIRSGGAE